MLIFNIILLGVISSFIIFFYKALKLSKSKGNIEGVRNSICCIVIIIVFDIFYVIYSVLLGFPLIPYPFDALMLIWIAAILGIQFLYKKFHKQKDDPSIGYINTSDFTLKHEIKRKITHLFILLLVAVYLGLGFIVCDFINNSIHIVDKINLNIWGITSLTFPREHSTWLISIFGVLGAVILIMIPEIFRLFSPEDYLFSKATKVMREDERYGISAPVSLSMGALITIVAISYVEISMAAITIAVIGDAAASLFGRKYGKHKISIYPSKSYEGLIGGILFGFIAGFIILLFTRDIYISLFLGLIGALLLGLIDLLKLNISDNILNPIIIGFGIYLFSFIYYF